MPAEWRITCSDEASRIVNPIRLVADRARVSSSPKPLIKLSIGDPTFDHNMLTPEAHIKAVQDAAASHLCDGYYPTSGVMSAREAVAKYWCDNFVPNAALHKDILAQNVVLTSGGSHAIQLAITAICNPGDNILIPAPGYPHYDTICTTYNIEARHYHLDPHNNWEASLDEIESLVDDRTKLFVMTNPSNPCGSNFSRQHVTELVRLCERLHLPMLSDEIYHGLVFQYESNPNKEFVSTADIESTVPRVILGGTAKVFVVPGWRLAWLILVDPAKVAAPFLYGIEQEAMLIVGSNSLAQAALPAALLETPPDYMPALVHKIETGALGFYEAVNQRCVSSPAADGSTKPMIRATLPQGAMYVMSEIVLDSFDPAAIKDDREFFDKLLAEENVQIVPGSAFNAPGFFRAVITRPLPLLMEAVDRMALFCQRHQRKQ